MIEPDSKPPLESEGAAPLLSETGPDPGAAPAPLRRIARRLLFAAGCVVLLVAGAALAFYIHAGSAGFEDLLRKGLATRLEAATGGRVEIASLHCKPMLLEAEARGVVIHGLEAPGEAPYAEIDSLRVGLSVLGFWSPRILLRQLEISHPQLHLIVYEDGSTNQPQPRTSAKPGRSALDTFFDLKANHLAVNRGMLDYDNRAATFDVQDRYLPLDFSADDASLRMAYLPPSAGNPESFHIEAGVAALNLARGSGSPSDGRRTAHGRFDMSLDLVRAAAYLRSFHLVANGHTLAVSGTLQDFAHPHWDARAIGEVDLGLLEPATGYYLTPQGIARLDLAAAGRAGQFRVDGSAHVDGGAHISPGVIATGIQLDAHVHADPEQLLVTSIVARLPQGGQMVGELALSPWLPPVPGGAVLQPAPPPGVRASGSRPKTLIKPVHPPPVFIPFNGKVKAEFQNVTLDTVLDIVGQPPYRRLGLDTLLNGPASATWSHGDVLTLVVSANLAASPSGRPLANEVPVTGAVEGTYFQRNGSVDLRRLEVHTPASQIEAHGDLGAFPLGSPTAISVDFHSRNLGEFDTVLRDLGLERNGISGAAALPVALGGQADFQGSWSGSLLDPHLAGTAKATQLSLELPPNPGDKSGKPQFVRWDTIEAGGSYSAARIVIDHGQLLRGSAVISVDGTLTSSPVEVAPGDAHLPLIDVHSPVRLHLRAAKVAVADLLPLFGQDLPLTGLLDAQIEAAGPLGTLNGSGWVQLDGGNFSDEPFTRIRAQGSITGHVIQLASITVNEDAGKIAATGSYDLGSHRFQLNANGSGIDVARIQWLRSHGFDVTGMLALSVQGSGTFDDPRLEAHASLADLALGGEPLGGLEMTAHSANRTLTYDLTTRIEAAELTAHGQTALGGDYATQARLEFSKFNIGALLKLAHAQGLNGESALAGAVTVEGPLARPGEMRGEARLQQLAVTVAGVHLHSEGGVHATLANSRINLDPVHITGEETDLRAQGTLALKSQRQLDFAASGTINLKVAETLDPDLTAAGSTTFQVEAHGPLANPDMRGRIDFQSGALSLEDLPNGLSQIHGTLEFNQNRLEVKSLTAMTGGGLVSVGGYLAYQHGLFADLSATGKGIRIRYPQGISSLADASLRLQGSQNNLLLSGDVLITRFTVSPDLDIAALANQANAVQPVAPPEAPSNHLRLDVHLTSSPQLNFQNAYAKLAGYVDLRLRGTLASPSLLGRVSITEGSAIIAGTRYELQRGDVSFTNPVRIQPSIDLNASAHVQDYDITLGLHGTPDKLAVTYRSDPPLPEADVVALLALGRTQDQQRIFTQQQQAAGSNPATDALLGGALNATVSSRVQRLFGAGAVKVDPSYLGALGNSTSRITVEEQLGSNVTLTYATNVNTTAQQLIQAEVAINRHVSLLVARDESGVFSMVIKATRRYR